MITNLIHYNNGIWKEKLDSIRWNWGGENKDYIAVNDDLIITDDTEYLTLIEYVKYPEEQSYGSTCEELREAGFKIYEKIKIKDLL